MKANLDEELFYSVLLQMPKLIDLQIIVRPDNLRLDRVPQNFRIKRLEITAVMETADKFLKLMPNLESLCLPCRVFDTFELRETINQLKKLKKISFKHWTHECLAIRLPLVVEASFSTFM